MTPFNLRTIRAYAGKLRGWVLFGAVVFLACMASSPELPAGFSNNAVRTHVEIDGTDFGLFDGVIGIEDDAGKNDEGGNVRHVVLQRDFVTDPSLYLWAKNTMRERTGLKDIMIVTENRDGDEIARYVLKSCQPVSWSVEAAALSSGGFHERIELAVQGVEVE